VAESNTGKKQRNKIRKKQTRGLRRRKGGSTQGLKDILLDHCKK